MRREFVLPEEDMEYLGCLEREGYVWETVAEGSGQWLIVHDWPVPDGYNHAKVDVALMIPRNYPDAQIDMAYFHPWLDRKDGKPIKATNSRQGLCGIEWQRWSRHRSAQNPWRPGVDNLSIHLTLVTNWLEREFMKG